MRALVPAETLVYLETNDLAAALQPIADAKPFKEVAKTKPDFSALKGVQLAVAVTGFETSEEKLTDEHSVGRVQPHFVAVADTHAWNYQAVAFAEKKLGGFVADIYDSEPTLERSDKHGGKYFIWTAADGRKAYALVIDSIIYFGNDEFAIDKCLAVKRDEADSVAKAGKVKPASQETLASGYVSTDGVAQIANIVGLQFASQASEESEVQSAIAGILPQLIRNSVTDVSWTAAKTEQGIEDKYQIGMPAEVANVLSESLASQPLSELRLVQFLPQDVPNATLYNFKDPQVAWRSILFISQKGTDAIAGKIMVEFSKLFFQPYGIEDPEMFLSSVNGKILTARFDDEGEVPLVIANVKDSEKVKKSLVKDLIPSKLPVEQGVSIWRATELELTAFFDRDEMVVGSSEAVTKSIESRPKNYHTYFGGERLWSLVGSSAAIVNVGQDLFISSKIVDELAERKSDNSKTVVSFTTETRFTKTGMERKTTSDFGLIGAIIAQLGQD
jgi:hypothetical protein